MKSLVNKVTEMAMTSEPNAAKVSYADLVKIVCNTMVQGGYATDDIRSRIAIMGACENVDVDATISLEDAYAVYLKGAVKNQRWAAMHKDIVAFVDDVTNL